MCVRPLSVRPPFRDNCNKETRTSVSCSEQRKLWAHFEVQLREENLTMGKSQLANGSGHGSSLQCKLALFAVCKAKMIVKYATLYTQSTIAMVCCSLFKVMSYLALSCHVLLSPLLAVARSSDVLSPPVLSSHVMSCLEMGKCKKQQQQKRGSGSGA